MTGRRRAIRLSYGGFRSHRRFQPVTRAWGPGGECGGRAASEDGLEIRSEDTLRPGQGLCVYPVCPSPLQAAPVLPAPGPTYNPLRDRPPPHRARRVPGPRGCVAQCPRSSFAEPMSKTYWLTVLESEVPNESVGRAAARHVLPVQGRPAPRGWGLTASCSLTRGPLCGQGQPVRWLLVPWLQA